jgi:polyhydroxyalkanoate synthesis regulator protein
MEGHANLPLPQLLKELENLPGFRDNPAWEQQRLREQVTKLYNMQPQQRKKLLEENEALARMTSEQRQQFDGVMQQYSALSPDRQRLVRGAFAVLRKVPQRDRQAAMNASPSLKQFSAHERNVLSNLLIWEPYFTEKGP